MRLDFRPSRALQSILGNPLVPVAVTGASFEVTAHAVVMVALVSDGGLRPT